MLGHPSPNSQRPTEAIDAIELDNRSVIFEVGTPSPVQVWAQESLVRQNSPVLREAIETAYRNTAQTSSWLRKKRKFTTEPLKIELPDEDARLVTAYVAWLKEPKLSFKIENYEMLVSLYLFGERNASATFCSTIVTRMLAKANSRPPILPTMSTINMIFENPATAGSPLRRFVVEIWKAKSPVDRIEAGHPEFIQQLLLALLKGRQDVQAVALKKKDVWKK